MATSVWVPRLLNGRMVLSIFRIFKARCSKSKYISALNRCEPPFFNVSEYEKSRFLSLISVSRCVGSMALCNKTSVSSSDISGSFVTGFLSPNIRYQILPLHPGPPKSISEASFLSMASRNLFNISVRS